MTIAAEKEHDGERRGEADRRGTDPRPSFALRRRLRHCRACWILIGIGILFGAYLASGFYVVAADERAVVRRFGAVAAQLGPGMHYALPWPVDRVDVVKTTSVMKVGVGFAPTAGESEAPSGMELLTGDTNILNTALVRRHDVESREEMGSDHSDKNDEDPTGAAAPEQAREAGTRMQVGSGSVHPASPLFAGTILISCECYRPPSSGFLFNRRSAPAERPSDAGGDAATPSRAGAEGDGPPGAG